MPFDTPHISEEELLRLLRAGGASRERGFRLLVQLHGDRLYAHVHRMVGNHPDTDDVLQNTFLKVHRYIDRFGEQAKLYTWLYRIATNETLSFLKKRQRLRTVSTEAENAPPEIAGDAYFDANAAQAALLHAIGTLPEKQRLVFNLRYFDELSYQDISTITGTSVGGLKASFHHAVKKVEQFLKQYITVRG